MKQVSVFLAEGARVIHMSVHCPVAEGGYTEEEPGGPGPESVHVCAQV